MRIYRALTALVLGAIMGGLLAGGLALGQDEPPPAAIAGYKTEAVAPGVWRIVDDATDAPLEEVSEVRVGRHGSVWLLSPEGAFKLGVGALGPSERVVDRLLEVGPLGEAWLRYRAADREGIGTWDGDTWTEITGHRRSSAFEPDPNGAPGVIRDFALGPNGIVWVVAGEQDNPRWQRFTIERLDGDGWTSWAIDDGLPALRCGKDCGDGSRVLAMDDGTVWASVDQGGLLRFEGGDWEPVRPLGGDDDLPVRSLVGEPDGVMWADVDSEAGTQARAHFDGRSWSQPADAQAEVGRPFDDRPLAVAPDGTLWSAGSEDSRPILWASDVRGRRAVTDLGACPVGDPVASIGCAGIVSAALDSDGLLWVITGSNVPRWAERGAALLVVDPASALKD